MENKGFRKAVVIFIDVLGTRDRTQFAEWYQIANIFYGTVQREKELDKAHEYVVYKREIHVFSDCAYIIYDYKDSVEDERKDANALMAIACYNTEKVLYEFLKNGFIVRGALTYGDIYYESDRDIFFGPAMNIAYDLESKTAKYPRVIIDSTFAEQLVAYNDVTYRKEELQRVMNGEIIKKDDDGEYFIHYLNSLELGMNHMEGREVVKKALELCDIERNKKCEDGRKKQSIKDKYDWLELYVKNSAHKVERMENIDITDPEVMREIELQELELIRNLISR